MDKVSKIIFDKCFKARKGERILIVTDKKLKSLGKRFFESAKNYGKSEYCEIDNLERNGSPPPKFAEKLMLQSDIIMLVTDKSLSHTTARKKANDAGARIASLPGASEDMLKRCIDVNYTKMKERSLKLAKMLDKGSNVRITTKLGTNLEFSINGRKSLPDYGDIGYKGAFDNLPSGETFIAPVEGTGNGTYFVDICMGTGLLKEPVKITIKQGFAVKFEGKYAAKIKSMFRGLPKKAFNLAEFGIGTNDKAIETGNILEDEKIYGTCHLALGNNITFGGKTNVPMHLDGVIRKPTIYIDGEMIMREGRLL